MPVELYLAPVAVGKTSFLVARARAMAQGLMGEPRVLVATRLQARAWQRRLAEAGGALGVRVGTFDDLYHELLSASGEVYRLLTEPIRYRLLRTLIAQAELYHYAPVRDMPGFAEVLLDLIAELKAGGVFPEALIGAVAQLGDEPRLAELAQLYQSYQASLQAHGWADYAGLGWLTAEALERHSDVPSGWPAVYIDGFDDLTTVQRRVLRLLSGRVGELIVTLTGIEQNVTRRIVHRRLDRTREALEDELGIVAKSLPTSSLSSRAPALRHVEATFLSGESSSVPADDAVALIAAPDREAEARAALRWLKQRLVNDGLALNEMVLLARRMEPYRAHVLAVAAEFGIPIHMADGLPLSGNPAVAALLDLLRLTVPGEIAFPWRLTVEAWRSPYFAWDRLGITRQDAEALAQVARWGSVLGGLETWRETFELLAAADPAGDGEVQEDEAPGGVLGGMPDRDAAKALWAKFEGFVARVTPPTGPQPCRVFVTWLEELIGSAEPDGSGPGDEVGLADDEPVFRVREGPADLVERDWAALQALKDVLRSLVWAEEAVHCEPTSYGGFVADLLGAVQAATYRLPLPTDSETLLVVDANQARGLRFRAVAILGLAEGEFPTTLTEDPLLRDADRERLRTEFDLAIDPSTQSAEAEYGYEAIARADQALLLTRPRIADNGAPWQASPYWEEVLRRVRTEPIELGGESFPSPAEAASWPELMLGVASRSDPASWAWARERAPMRTMAMERAVAVLWQRSRSPDAMTTAYDGDLTRWVGIWSQRFGRDHVWSTSRLETYRTCPLMFFLGNVLALEPRQPPSEGLDGRQLGTLYHRILAQLYSRVGDPSDLEQLLDALPEIAKQILDQAPRRERFRPTRWWTHTREEIIENVRRSLQALAESPGGYVPHAHEQAFGLDGQAFLVLDGDEEGDSVLLRGLVDRVDRALNGDLRIVDYKTAGKSAYSPRAMAEGRKLQLPLYAKAVEEALGLGHVVEGFYWHVQQAERSDFTLSRFEGGPPGAMVVAVAHARDALEGVRAGRFRPQPPDGGCPSYCSGAAFCWHQSRRW